MSDVEIWKNVSRGRRGIIKFDAFGKTTHELIPAGKTVRLTRDERLYYQRNVATESLDIFQNGALVPIQLIDEEDKREVANNPNLMSDDELIELFKIHWKKFEAEIKRITNPYALERMIEYAEESENVSHKKVLIIQERLDEVKEASAHTTPVRQSLVKGSGKVNF
jgi:hypothetical protein